MFTSLRDFIYGRRICFQNYEMYKCVLEDEWTRKIRCIFQDHAKIVWCSNYEDLIRNIYKLYHIGVPFHNHTHAYDVLHFGVCLLVRCENVFNNMSPIQRFTFCIALLCHDIDHMGFTNADLENTSRGKQRSLSNHSLSSYCSDDAYNEIHHIEISQELFIKHKISFDQNLFSILVSHTDLRKQESFVEQSTNNDFFDVTKYLTLLMKMADIGHVFRPWRIHLHFVNAMNKERTIPLLPRMLPDDTIEFNQRFVLPLLVLIEKYNKNLHTELRVYYDANINRWNSVKTFMDMTN